MHSRFRISAGILVLSIIVFACNAGEVKTDKQKPPAKSSPEKVQKAAPKIQKKAEKKTTTVQKAAPKVQKKVDKKTTTEKKSNAVISIDSAHFDAGVFKQGKVQSVKHDFVIRNTGTDTLIIEKVKPG